MPVALSSGQRSAARVVAVAFPVSMFAVAFANFGLRGAIVVEGDIAETIRRIAASTSTYRLSIALDLLYSAGMVVLSAALYTILRDINRGVALLAAMLKLIYAGTAVMIALSSLAMLRLSTEAAYGDQLGSGAQKGLVQLAASGAWDQYYVGLVFWAFSSTLFAWLWLKSGHLPRALASAGVVASAWCAFCAIAFLLNPAFATAVNVWAFDTPMALYYLAVSFWLLMRWRAITTAS